MFVSENVSLLKEASRKRTRVSLGDTAVTPTQSAAPNREPSSPASVLLVSMGTDAYATVGRSELTEPETKKPLNISSVVKGHAGCWSSLQSVLLSCKCCPFERLFDIFMQLS